jgi:hypothetical protein
MLSEHVGDLGEQVWRMCGLVVTTRAAGFSLRNIELLCTDTRGKKGGLTRAADCAEGRHFHVIRERIWKFM